MDKNTLIRFKFKLLGIKPKPKFLTVKKIRKIMENGEDMPTAIFSAERKDYIIKPRIIYNSKTRIKSKEKIRI